MKYKLQLRGANNPFAMAFVYSSPDIRLQIGSVFVFESKHWEIKAIVHSAIKAEIDEIPVFDENNLTTLIVESFPIL